MGIFFYPLLQDSAYFDYMPAYNSIAKRNTSFHLLSYPFPLADTQTKAKWAGFEYAGDEPTLEEFILWMAGQIKESGD